jgi:hypothetical protein
LAKGEGSLKEQDLLLFSQYQILIWSKRFLELGIEGEKDKPKTGCKSQLSQEQLKLLRNLVLNEILSAQTFINSLCFVLLNPNVPHTSFVKKNVLLFFFD